MFFISRYLFIWLILLFLIFVKKIAELNKLNCFDGSQIEKSLFVASVLFLSLAFVRNWKSVVFARTFINVDQKVDL